MFTQLLMLHLNNLWFHIHFRAGEKITLIDIKRCRPTHIIGLPHIIYGPLSSSEDQYDLKTVKLIIMVIKPCPGCQNKCLLVFFKICLQLLTQRNTDFKVNRRKLKKIKYISIFLSRTRVNLSNKKHDLNYYLLMSKISTWHKLPSSIVHWGEVFHLIFIWKVFCCSLLLDLPE